ncbi:MAG: 16S rRNA (cytosine(967)-C(5))-methyltransferase RsmB, partial [Bacillota bacterium]
GGEVMSRAPRKPREAALEALLRVDGEGATPQSALEAQWAGTETPKRDRALATELVYGSLRRRNALDWVLAKVATRPLAEVQPRLLWVLRLGAYQLLFLDRIPAHAAVDEAVRQASVGGHKGITGFVNGVLRNLARRLADGSLALPGREGGLENYLRVTESHPEWLVRRWLAELGPEQTAAICRLDNEPAPTCVRANRVKNDRVELAARLRAEGVTVVEAALAPDGLTIDDYSSLPELTSFREGRFFVQDEAAMLVAPLLDPRPGETLVDACSAPGGKATHLAELTGDQARILAVELAQEKLPQIAENCRRLGLSGVAPVHGDARRLPEFAPGPVDGVLVDAPCSGLGVLRRRPDSRWRKRPEDPAALAPLQLALLDAAAKTVAPGGRVVYSTCTIARTENEDVVRAFLDAHPDFRPADLRPLLPVALRDEPGAAAGALQLLPSTHGTDGFFVARFDRSRA